MRRALSIIALCVSLGAMTALPAAAEVIGLTNGKIQLSFDFSDNSNPASASGDAFNIIVDVLPEHTAGVVRVVAVAPDSSDASNLVCRYQVVAQSQVECGFNFTASGTWEIRAEFATSKTDSVSAVAITNIDVGP